MSKKIKTEAGTEAGVSSSSFSSPFSSCSSSDKSQSPGTAEQYFSGIRNVPTAAADGWSPQDKWKYKVEEEREKKEQQAREQSKANVTTQLLRRQSKKTPGWTIHKIFGGNCQIPTVYPSEVKLQNQKKLLVDGKLNQVEQMMMLVNTQLHPFAPGHQFGVTSEVTPINTGTVQLGLDDKAILERRVGVDHVFPLFCGDNGNWWYVGHYRFDEAGTEIDDDVRTMTGAECRAHMGDGWVYKLLKEAGDYGENWVDALSAKNCTWNSGLTALQEKFKKEAERVSRPKEYQRLSEEKLLLPKSGTPAQRKRVVRDFLDEGSLIIERSELRFVKFDEKLHQVLQERCAGKFSLERQKKTKTKKKKKRRGREKYLKGTTFRKKFVGVGTWVGEVVEVNHDNVKPYRIVWRCGDQLSDENEWYDGDEIAKAKAAEASATSTAEGK